MAEGAAEQRGRKACISVRAFSDYLISVPSIWPSPERELPVTTTYFLELSVLLCSHR